MSHEELRSIESIAARAPSPHNTQPWKVIFREEDLRLDYDPERHLEASDPCRRDLLLALGSFIEGFLIAASEADCGLEFIHDIDFERSQVGRFRRTASHYKTPFSSNDILKRQTSRLPYRRVTVDAALGRSLQGSLTSGERLCYLEGSTVHDLLGPADRHFFDTPAVAQEFRRWARLTPFEMASHQDGLSADCLALSKIEARLLSFLLSESAYPWFRRLRLSKILSAINGRIVPQSAQLIALISQSGDPGSTLDAGRSLMRLWLTLSKYGIYSHPLSQILDFPDARQKLSERLGCVASEVIVSIFRFGVSEAPAVSRRRV
jgi:hypothetical protein